MVKSIRGVWVFGKGRLAIETAKLANSLPQYVLKGVVPVRNEPDWDLSFRSWGIEFGCDVMDIDDWRQATTHSRDIGLSIYFDELFKPSDIARLDTFLNLHNSPLPKYRGMRPINWALENQESSHGVTLHKIERGIDTGAILGQIIFPIFHKNQEVRDVYESCIAHAKVLIEDVLKFSDFNDFKPQDDSSASYYSSSDIGLLLKRSGWERI